VHRYKKKRKSDGPKEHRAARLDGIQRDSRHLVNLLAWFKQKTTTATAMQQQHH
jgi:hypothetical protein